MVWRWGLKAEKETGGSTIPRRRVSSAPELGVIKGKRSEGHGFFMACTLSLIWCGMIMDHRVAAVRI